MTQTKRTTQQGKKSCTWYVLEWNALDYQIELYKYQSRSNEQSEAYEEILEELHNYSSILLMEEKRLRNLFKAVLDFRKIMKGGKTH
ncbi:MAG: hypothetical protein PHR77_03250 [Kiritimatiellae bacterium]|nr:hypothetical protein [Kiritimatiellia bacterium]MDD5519574.1 hypothetical protein [Kiritimatiellia bacterium]